MVTIAILVTIAIPHFFGHLEKARDAKRGKNIQQVARVLLIEDSSSSSSRFQYDNTSLDTIMRANSIALDETNAAYCYVYGYKLSGAPGFFLAVQSEKNTGHFLFDGDVNGKQHFADEAALKSEMLDCSPLTTPTGDNGYAVFYVQ